MGCGREEITWFSGGEDAGEGGSVDFGEITWFSGGKIGGSGGFWGDHMVFRERRRGGGGKSVVTNGV